MDKQYERVMVISSGPVGSAQPATSPAETDLTCRELVNAGKEVILLTSDPNIFRSADPRIHYFITPLTAEFVSQVIRREHPDAILPSAGGQIALNIMQEIDKSGLLEQLHVRVLGSSIEAMVKSEDGEQFRAFLNQAQIPTPESTYVNDAQAALNCADRIGYPVLMRRGQSRSIARTRGELSNVIAASIGGGRILIERAIHRFKAVQFVMMRDSAGTCVLLGTIESLDPVGVNAANTTVVTPAQTITDRDRSALRSAGIEVMNKLGILGCATLSFAIDPRSSDWYMLKLKLGLSWTSSLIARATAYPVAGVNTAVALGERLDQIRIGAHKQMVAAIEPGVDAIVARFPQFPRQLQTGAQLGPQLLAGGAIMTAGRTLEATLMQGIYTLGHDDSHVLSSEIRAWNEDEVTAHVIKANALRLPALWLALTRGFTVRELSELSQINPLFIAAISKIINCLDALALDHSTLKLRQAKNYGIADATIASIWQVAEEELRQTRQDADILPTYKTLDAMGLIEPDTPTYYASYGATGESEPGNLPSVIVIEPNTAAPWLNSAHESISSAMLAAIKDSGCTPILLGSTPRPLVYPGVKHYLLGASNEHILDVLDLEQPLGVICQTAGREGSRIAHMLKRRGITILGSAPSKHGANRVAPKLRDALAALSTDGWQLEYCGDIAGDPESTHLAIDAIADGQDVAVLGVINSLEQSESRAGKVLAVTPPRKGAAKMTEKAVATAVSLTRTLGLVGFVHLDLVVRDQHMAVTFIGPSASATVPFLAKTVRKDVVAVACAVLLGQKLADLGIQSGQLEQAPGVHVLLPVLRSGLTAPGSQVPTIVQTGLVMGSDMMLGKALIKAFAAAHQPLSAHGTVLLEEGTTAGAALAPRLANLGFQIVGMERAKKLNNVQLIVIDKPDIDFRRRATAHMVPLINTVSADAILQVFEARAFSMMPLSALER
jgi:carbamoyl-phosphate synthase large subunit